MIIAHDTSGYRLAAVRKQPFYKVFKVVTKREPSTCGHPNCPHLDHTITTQHLMGPYSSNTQLQKAGDHIDVGNCIEMCVTGIHAATKRQLPTWIGKYNWRNGVYAVWRVELTKPFRSIRRPNKCKVVAKACKMLYEVKYNSKEGESLRKLFK